MRRAPAIILAYCSRCVDECGSHWVTLSPCPVKTPASPSTVDTTSPHTDTILGLALESLASYARQRAPLLSIVRQGMVSTIMSLCVTLLRVTTDQTTSHTLSLSKLLFIILQSVYYIHTCNGREVCQCPIFSWTVNH